jgi:hypothetical protein
MQRQISFEPQNFFLKSQRSIDNHFSLFFRHTAEGNLYTLFCVSDEIISKHSQNL